MARKPLAAGSAAATRDLAASFGPAALVLGLGLLWRAALIAAGGDLHVDEGNFATVARHVAATGDWALNGARTDKPPLTFWLQALTMLVAGPTPGAARAATLIGYGVGAWAVLGPLRSVWGGPAALVGAALWAFSPLGALHGTAAMSDIYVMAFGLACLACIAVQKPRAAALCFLLSFASKPTGLLYGFMAFAMLLGPGRSEERRAFVRTSLIGLGLIALHSLLFANPRFGAFFRPDAAAENPAARFHPSLSAWAQRWAFWRPVLGLSVGTWAWLPFGAALAWGLGFGPARWRGYLSLFLLGFAFLFLGLGMPLFERHLLLLLPVLFMAAMLPWAGKHSRLAWATAAGLAFCLGVNTAQANWRDSLPQWGPRFQGTQGWAALAGRLNPQLKPGEGVVLFGALARQEGWTAGFYLQCQGRSVKLYDSADGAVDAAWTNAVWGIARAQDRANAAQPPVGGEGRVLEAWRLSESPFKAAAKETHGR